MPLDIVLNLFSDLLIIIRDEYGNVIPELGCGHKIEMIGFKFEYKE